MNQIQKWHRDRVVILEMSEVAQTEARKGRDMRRTSKALGYSCSETLATHSEDADIFRQLEEVLFPAGAKSASDKNDIEIAFNARKYSAILVTDEGASKSQPRGFLGCRAELNELGVTVMRDFEAVAHIKERLHTRDKAARWRSKTFSQPLPDWVDQD